MVFFDIMLELERSDRIEKFRGFYEGRFAPKLIYLFLKYYIKNIVLTTMVASASNHMVVVTSDPDLTDLEDFVAKLTTKISNESIFRAKTMGLNQSLITNDEEVEDAKKLLKYASEENKKFLQDSIDDYAIRKASNYTSEEHKKFLQDSIYACAIKIVSKCASKENKKFQQDYMVGFFRQKR